MQIQGYVQEIRTKTTKIGPMYDLVVNGDSYGVGKYAPRDINKGDYVEFVMEQNGNFRNVGRGTLRKLEASAGAVPQAAPVRQAVPSSFDDRQIVISKQAALNTAIAFVEMAVKAGALSLPEGKAKGYGVLEQAVFEQAAKFHLFSTGTKVEIPDASEGAKTPAKRTAKAAAPEDSEWEDDELPEGL